MNRVVAVVCLVLALVLSQEPGGNSVPGVTVPGDGIRVLWVRPSDPSEQLPNGHDNLPSLGVVRDWQKTNKADWRNWPEGTDDSKAPDAFKVMFGLPRDASRWVYVANGSKLRHSGPWPKTGDEAVKILESCK